MKQSKAAGYSRTSIPAKLLVVDDNRVNRLVLSRSLEKYGHIVETANDGSAGLEKIRSGTYDLVLLDIEMPEMNGYQVLEACLGDVDLRQIPIIMTSAMDELDAVVKCVELGAEDYLTKPVNPILLRARVNASLEKKRLRDEQRKLFRTFATKEVAEELLHSGFSLGGKYVTASIMFADIRSFTTLAEFQDPTETIDLLNRFFGLMFEAINRHGGSVNQVVGDGFMAVFGVPLHYEDHCERAVRAGMDMLAQLEVFNREQADRGKSPLQIGIGVASGNVIAGYTGTQSRAVYTCVGDTVNLASRIEAHTKQAGVPFIIDSTTNDSLPPTFKSRPLGSVIFKGKTQANEIFAMEADGR